MKIPATLFLQNPLQGKNTARLTEIYSAICDLSDTEEKKALLSYIEDIIVQKTADFDEQTLRRKVEALSLCYPPYSSGAIAMEELMKKVF